MGRSRFITALLTWAFLAAAMPAVAYAGTGWIRFYTSPSSGDSQNVWKSRNMTSYGKFQKARVNAIVSGCGAGGKEPVSYCVYGDIAAPNAGTAYGITPVTMSFSSRTGTFKCRWSAPGGGKNRLLCDVGGPN